MLLRRSVETFANGLDNILHGAVQDPRRIHLITFVAFLEAALELKGRRKAHETSISKMKMAISPYHVLATKLMPGAAEVIHEVKAIAKSSVITVEASAEEVRKKVASVFHGMIDYVLVLDALSPVEFISLLVVAKRNGFRCDLSSEFLVNPLGRTWFVKEQVREEWKRLRNYAKELAEAVGCVKYDVAFDFDKAIHSALAMPFTLYLAKMEATHSRVYGGRSLRLHQK